MLSINIGVTSVRKYIHSMWRQRNSTAIKHMCKQLEPGPFFSSSSGLGIRLDHTVQWGGTWLVYTVHQTLPFFLRKWVWLVRLPPLSPPLPHTHPHTLTRSDGVVSPKQMQSPPAQTKVFNNMEDLLRLLHTTQLWLQMRRRESDWSETCLNGCHKNIS